MMNVQIKRTKGDSQLQKTHDTQPTVSVNKLFSNIVHIVWTSTREITKVLNEKHQVKYNKTNQLTKLQQFEIKSKD